MLSAICGARQRVCDLCEQPAIKALDTRLMPHSLVHDACLAEQFPGYANEQLEMRNPRSQHAFFTLPHIRAQMINAGPDKRGVYFNILERILGERFDQLPIPTKISLLADAGTTMPDRADGRRPHLQIGPRPLGRHDCLELALELALEHQPRSIAAICQRLLNLQPAYLTVSLFGINFKRTRIMAWADGRDLPEVAQVAAHAYQLDGELQRDNAENVHAGAVIQHSLQQLRKMQCQGNQSLTAQQAYYQIDTYLRRIGAPHAAFDGLERVRGMGGQIPHFHITLDDGITSVWRYVTAQTNAALSANLHAAFVARLVDIADTHPCGLGMLQRLVDTPTAVDLSMASSVSAQALRDEVGTIAAEVNEEFEALYGEAAEAQLRTAPPQPDASDPALRVSEIKRAMVLQRAQVELVVLRKLAPEVVRQAVDQVFPEGMVL